MRKYKMDAEERKALIRRYRDGHRAVVDAFLGVTDEELDRSATDEWTPRMIAPHLADSEMMSAIRERLTEDDWRRAGTHSESGPYSVESWLHIYAKHGHDHAEQVKRSRGKA